MGVKVRKGFCINCVEVRNDWVVEGIEEWATMKLMMSYFEKGRCQKNGTIFTSGGMMGSIFPVNLFELFLPKPNWQTSTSQCSRHLSC